MNILDNTFAAIAADNCPGQEGLQATTDFMTKSRGANIPGPAVDFSHGDVDAFTPTPGAFEVFAAGVQEGAEQAYTVYRGRDSIRQHLADKLTAYTGAPVAPGTDVIITPGTQGALFLAVASVVGPGDSIAIMQPDYFANRKIAVFLGATMVPIRLNYLENSDRAGIDLDQLEQAFASGTRAFLFSTPNNPAGVIYAREELTAIAALAERYGVTIIVDELYSRLLYDGRTYTHLRALDINPDKVVTIIGPSKTESLSGYRLGVAFGSARIIDRMEKLQAIVSLRAAGYCQAVLTTWFAEPQGWLEERIRLHQAIRDDLLKEFRTVEGLAVRTPEAGSYLFPKLPPLAVPVSDFCKLLRHQAAVTVTPGTEFAPHTHDSVRLNFSQDHAAALAAVRRMTQLVERYRV